MLGGGAPRWQIKDRIKGNRPRSAQAQLDTPIPPACPESHSSRSSSSLEHSAEDTMSSVVCGERETVIRRHCGGCLLAIPFKDISANTDLPACPPPSIHHIGQSYFTVFIIPYFMCFPPLQIIVFLHPSHPAPPHYLSPLFSSVFHDQWPHQAPTDQHCPSLICAEGREGRALATPAPPMHYLYPPVPGIQIYPLPASFFVFSITRRPGERWRCGTGVEW